VDYNKTLRKAAIQQPVGACSRIEIPARMLLYGTQQSPLADSTCNKLKLDFTDSPFNHGADSNDEVVAGRWGYFAAGCTLR
jgi:hypothetical protein